MKKMNRRWCALAWVCILLFSFIPSVQAASSNTLHIYKYENQQSHLLFEKPSAPDLKPVQGAVFKIWQLQESDRGRAAEDIAAELNSKSLTELDSKYASFESAPTDTEGHTQFTELADGIYYGRQLQVDAYRQIVEQIPFVVELPHEGAQEVSIYPKSYEETKTEKTQVRLIKYRNEIREEARLEGVGFSLYRQDAAGDLLITAKKSLDDYTAAPDGDTVLYTNARGEIRVNNLEPGTYYFKEVEPLEGYHPLEENPKFTLEEGKEQVLEVVNTAEKLGLQKFRKVDENGIPLPGATFKIARKVVDAAGTRYEVVREGELLGSKEVIARSDEDGYFTFYNLPYGDYVLMETKAPVVDGVVYQLLREPVPFTVSEETTQNATTIQIVNHKGYVPPPPPEPPKPPIDIPYTGGLAFIISACAGLGLFAMGLWMARDEKKEPSE